MTTLLETAKNKLDANEAYYQAIRKEMESLDPLDPDTFWKVLDVLAEDIFEDAESKHPRGVKSVMHNFMCSAVYGTLGEIPVEGWETPDRSGRLLPCEDDPQKQGSIMLHCWENTVRFLNRYEQIKSDLYKKMDAMPGLERGDDGFGDLMDSLPLAGREVVCGIMEDDIANYKQLERALTERFGTRPLESFILRGENYICMMLSEALQKAYLSVANDLTYDPDKGRRRHANPHCVIVGGLGDTLTVYGPYVDKYEANDFVRQEGDGKVFRLCAKPVTR